MLNRTNTEPVLIRKNAAGATLETIQKTLGTTAAAITEFRTKVEGDLTVHKSALDGLGSRLDKIEARGNRKGESSDAVGSQVIETIMKSQGFANLKAGQLNSGRIEIPGGFQAIRKALLSTQAGGSPNWGYDVMPQRSDRIGEDPRRRLSLLDVLPHLPVTSNAFEYQSLDGYTNAAADQGGEASPKAAASVGFTLQSARIVTIAHYQKASRQVLDDAPVLARYLNSLLTYGVSAKAESKFVAANDALGIVGLVPLANAFVPTATHAPDQISEALATLDSLGWNAGLIVLNPLDWHRIRSERATGGDEQYVATGWNQPAAANIWGTPLVTTPSLTAGTALVLDPEQVAILDRSQVTVSLGYENDDFTKNLVTMLAEGRFGFAVFSNGGVLKLTLSF